MSIYYATCLGYVNGIFLSWEECAKAIELSHDKYYETFDNLEDAINFVQNGRMSRAIQTEEFIDELKVYTDGSSHEVDGILKAGYGVYIPSKDIKVSANIKMGIKTSDDAELIAIEQSLKLDEVIFDRREHIVIYTDSQGSIDIFNFKGEEYKKNKWIKKDGTEVRSKETIERILKLKKRYEKVYDKKIRLEWVKGHSISEDENSVNNQIADKLAKEGRTKRKK